MYPLERLWRLLEFLQELFVNGQIMTKYNTLELLEEFDYITYLNTLTTRQTKTILEMLTPNIKSVIAEFLQTSKEMIWKDKYNLCEQNFQNIQSLLISVLESISNGKTSSTFWNSLKGEMSRKLLLPTVTDSVGSLSNSLTGCFEQTESNSWFSIKTWKAQNKQNSLKTFYPSLQFSIAASTEKENIKKLKTRQTQTNKTPTNISKKYRLYPDNETKQELIKWFGCVRKTYNIALDNIKNNKVPQNRKTNMRWLRNRFINANNMPKKLNYLLKTPKHVREGALNDLVDAYKVNLVKAKKNGTTFEMKYRSRKENQSILIDHYGIKKFTNNSITIYPTMLKNPIKLFRHDNIKIEHDCRLILDRLGRFYIAVPYHKMKSDVRACENQTGSVVAIDPGVRTAHTIFGYKNEHFEIKKFGDQDITRIYRLCKHLDKLISKNSKLKKHTLKRAEYKLRDRIKNLIKDYHWKVINYLCNNYENIIIPPFEVKDMINKTQRKIGKNSVRKMLSWSHYSFKQRLLYKAEFYKCKVHILGEHYTTKTCTHCGYCNYKIKAQKIIECPCCHIRTDRDIAGARNIFIKNAAMI